MSMAKRVLVLAGHPMGAFISPVDWGKAWSLSDHQTCLICDKMQRAMFASQVAAALRLMGWGEVGGSL